MTMALDVGRLCIGCSRGARAAGRPDLRRPRPAEEEQRRLGAWCTPARATMDELAGDMGASRAGESAHAVGEKGATMAELAGLRVTARMDVGGERMERLHRG